MARLPFSVVAIAAACFVTAAWAPAQEKSAPQPEATAKSSAPKKETAAQSSEKPAEPAKSAGIGTREPEPWELVVGERVWVRVKAFERLHKMILDRVPLTDEEKKEFADKFADIKKRMIENPRWASRGTPRPLWSKEERAALETKLAEAQAKGDSAAAAELQTEIAKGTSGTEENSHWDWKELAAEVQDTARPEKRDAVVAVVDRWGPLERTMPFDGPIRMLNRALRDPDLKLSEEQRNGVQKALAEAMKELPTDKRSDTKKQEAGAQAKARVMSILNDEQKKILEANVAESERQYAEFLDFKRRFHRQGMTQPTRIKSDGASTEN